jgi:NADH-quinone oxidoreductase subunit J
MILDRLLFDFFSAIAAASALAMVTRRNPLHSAILLLATLLATGGVFLQLRAEYVFGAEVLLFAGGIVLLFVLAVMLLYPESLRQDASFPWKRYAVSALALVIAMEILAIVWARRDRAIWPATTSLPVNNTSAIGGALFRDDLLALEFMGVPLLATVIGVVMLTKRRPE